MAQNRLFKYLHEKRGEIPKVPFSGYVCLFQAQGLLNRGILPFIEEDDSFSTAACCAIYEVPPLRSTMLMIFITFLYNLSAASSITLFQNAGLFHSLSMGNSVAASSQ